MPRAGSFEFNVPCEDDLLVWTIYARDLTAGVTVFGRWCPSTAPRAKGAASNCVFGGGGAGGSGPLGYTVRGVWTQFQHRSRLFPSPCGAKSWPGWFKEAGGTVSFLPGFWGAGTKVKTTWTQRLQHRSTFCSGMGGRKDAAGNASALSQ